MTARYEVVIAQYPEDYIRVLKELRAWSGWGLKQAKEFYEYTRSNCPCVAIAGIKQEAAEDLKKYLDRAGVRVLVRESSIEHPMLVYPQADDRYENHWFFGLRKCDRKNTEQHF